MVQYKKNRWIRSWLAAWLLTLGSVSITAQPSLPQPPESRLLRMLREREEQVREALREEASQRQHFIDLQLVLRQQNAVKLANYVEAFRELRFPPGGETPPLRPAPSGRVASRPPPSKVLLEYRVDLRNRALLGDEGELKAYELDVRRRVSEPGADIEWTYLLAMCLAYQDEPAFASALLYHCFNERPGESDIVVAFLRSLHRSGADLLAASLVDRYRELMIEVGDFHAVAAEIFWKVGRYEASLEEAEAWTRREPGKAAAWNGLGEKTFRRARYTEARTLFARALSLDPTHLSALEHMARLSARAKDTDDTLQWLKRYRARVSEEQFVALLNRDEFIHVPGVLILLD